MESDGAEPNLGEYVRRLAEHTDISEAQALELITLLGLNWASLVREANLIKAPRRRP